MLAIAGAVKEEIANTRKRMNVRTTLEEAGCCLFEGSYGSKDVILVQTGIGGERARAAAQLLGEKYSLSALISIGFGGALGEDLQVGDIVLCRQTRCGENENGRRTYYSDDDLLMLSKDIAREAAGRVRVGGGVTVNRVLTSPDEKRAVGREYGADVVDMESYWLAEAAALRGVPFLGVRVVSDTATERLPDLGQLVDADGAFLWQKAAGYLPTHLPEIGGLSVMYRNVVAARRQLGVFVDRLIGRL